MKKHKIDISQGEKSFTFANNNFPLKATFKVELLNETKSMF